MKKLILLLTFLTTLSIILPLKAQDYYNQQWKVIEKQFEKGEFKSNLPIILEIQKKAMKDQNVPELIKSLKAEFSVLENTLDDENNNVVSGFYAKIDSVTKPFGGSQKAVLDLLKLKFVDQYYDANFWEISQRTNLDNSNISEIETWSNKAFKNYFTKEYEKLFAKEAMLKGESIKNYKSIFNNDFDVSIFPTIYDYAANEYMDLLDNNQLFTKNELSENKKIKEATYNSLIKSNVGNARLYFQNEKIKFENNGLDDKEQLKKQLFTLLNSKDEGDYKLVIAGNYADILITENKESEALGLLKTYINKYKKSPFVGNLQSKIDHIESPQLNVFYENKTLPNLPIHLVVDYKNATKLSVNIYEVKDDLQDFLEFVNSNYRKNFSQVNKQLVRKDNYDLKDLGDYKSHKSSIELKALPRGIYMLEYLVDGDKTSEPNDYMLVSNAISIYKNLEEQQPNKAELLWVYATNGKPLNNDNLFITEFVSGKSIESQNIALQKDGSFILPIKNTRDYSRLYLIQNKKTGDVELKKMYGLDVNTGRNTNQEGQTRAQVYLDRSIYRPGQLVYFKVINTQIKNQKEGVLSQAKQTVILQDANGKNVGEQVFSTNDFGSYHGSFALPKGLLNGNFSILVDDNINRIKNVKYFNVEEYKRPNFEINFEPIKGEYKYGQTIELKGKASTFSGISLNNVTVNYEIKKENLRWRYFPWLDGGQNNDNSIIGEVKTDDKGDFTILLDLKKDENLKGIQVDNFKVNASVTDISGETQFANTNVVVASVTHFIEAENINNNYSNQAIKLNVKPQNYNGQTIEKSYQVKLLKLENTDRIYRDNFKNYIQDNAILSKADFIKLFPNDRYNKEDLEVNKKVEKIVLEKTQNNSQLDLGKLDAGSYRLELFNIEGNDTIKVTKDFEIFNPKKLEIGQNHFLEVVNNDKKLKAGDVAKFGIYSSVPNAILHIYTQFGDGKTKYETKTAKDGLVTIETKVPQNISFLNVQVLLAAYNDVQVKSINLPIESNEDILKIETVTFRDKLLPNSKEKWSVKVTGSKKDAVNAEVLANMYDKSLDQFAANNFDFDKILRNTIIINNYDMRRDMADFRYFTKFPYIKTKNIVAPYFNWYNYGVMFTESALVSSNAVMRSDFAEGYASQSEMKSYAPAPAMDKATRHKEEINSLDDVKIRENLNETAFFYPSLLTDKEGNVSFEFTSPEALTQWKLMFLAHTKDAKSAMLEKTVVTQKEFSVTPNYPRFLREGDVLNFQTKLSSLVNKSLKGNAQLQIIDASTNEDISSQFNLNATKQDFSVNANSSNALTWSLTIPKGISSVILKVVAKAGDYSDGEQKAIAVLPNRMLVTDAIPVFVKEGETKTFVLDHLLNNKSTTLTNVSNTLELTTNPIWEILFALPSLKNDQNKSADVIFNKWFADVLASEIFKSNPKLKSIFEEYQSKGLLKSNLEKNQELKQLLLEETPWVLENDNEEAQMQKIARLFDANNMRFAINQDWSALTKLQNADGGFSWYEGYSSSFNTSLYILKHLGKINDWLKGNVKDYQPEDQTNLVKRLIDYVDIEVKQNWEIKKDNPWSNTVFTYLDARQYWENDFPLNGNGLTLKNLVIKKSSNAKIKDFTFYGLHRAAALFDRYGKKEVSQKLLTYLKETTVESKNQGIYWKQNLNDWGWFGSQVVNHAGALEVFNKLMPNDVTFLEELKIWLVTQKEVNAWGTSRGTAEVIFTILNSGKSWTSDDSDRAKIVWGGKEVTKGDVQATGFIKSTINSTEVDPNLGTLTVTKSSPGIVQGGLYWQYYEELDNIKSSENYLSITKEYYKKIKTVNGEELVAISNSAPISVGDRITVRMILNTNRAMEFVHLKDMRAAGLEPVNVISQYQWKNNLGYYESTKDASTNFYIEYMPKGKYVFEYDLVANASGEFSNGISTLQNYYAPQMSSHTKGSKIEIKP